MQVPADALLQVEVQLLVVVWQWHSSIGSVVTSSTALQ